MGRIQAPISTSQVWPNRGPSVVWPGRHAQAASYLCLSILPHPMARRAQLRTSPPPCTHPPSGDTSPRGNRRIRHDWACDREGVVASPEIASHGRGTGGGVNARDDTGAWSLLPTRSTGIREAWDDVNAARVSVTRVRSNRPPGARGDGLGRELFPYLTERSSRQLGARAPPRRVLYY